MKNGLQKDQNGQEIKWVVLCYLVVHKKHEIRIRKKAHRA